jgi:hypothetical protein
MNKLRERLKENIITIQSYKEENLLLRKGKPEMEASRDILRKIEVNDNEIIRMKCTLQEVTANYEALNIVFEKCKKRNSDFLDDIREKKEHIINLTGQITALERTQGAVDDLKEQLKEAEQERNDMETRIKDLLTEPFLKRESGTSTKNRMAKLEMERDEKDKIIRNFKEKLLKQEEKMAEMDVAVELERRDAKESKEMYEELKIRYEGNGEMTIETVTRQLHKIDPSAFRQTMNDLNYQGHDSVWDRTGEGYSSEEIDINDPKSLHKEIERLRHSKRDIAAELEKCQQMIKLQSNLEEEKISYIKEEAEQLRIQNKAYKTKIDDLANQLDQKAKENAELRKALAGRGFTGKIGGKDFKLDKTMDSISDFSEMTEETGLGHQENVLDVAIDRAEFHANSIVQMLGKSKVKEDSFNTFIALSFYDHDTQATDICNGFNPGYATQFAFRNKFDDFYINHLDTRTLKIEVYQSKLDKPLLIGTANVLLKDLVQIDRTNPNPKKVVSSVVEVMSISNPDVAIGTIKYKMRLRNDFNQSIKIYHEKKASEAQHEMNRNTKSKIKCLTFEIIECRDLTKKGVKSKKIEPF